MQISIFDVTPSIGRIRIGDQGPDRQVDQKVKTLGSRESDREPDREPDRWRIGSRIGAGMADASCPDATSIRTL